MGASIFKFLDFVGFAGSSLNLEFIHLEFKFIILGQAALALFREEHPGVLDEVWTGGSNHYSLKARHLTAIFAFLERHDNCTKRSSPASGLVTQLAGYIGCSRETLRGYLKGQRKNFKELMTKELRQPAHSDDMVHIPDEAGTRTELECRIRRRLDDCKRADEIIRLLEGEVMLCDAVFAHVKKRDLECIGLSDDEANAVVLNDSAWKEHGITWIDRFISQLPAKLQSEKLQKRTRQAIVESGIAGTEDLFSKAECISLPRGVICYIRSVRPEGQLDIQSFEAADATDATDACNADAARADASQVQISTPAPDSCLLAG